MKSNKIWNTQNNIFGGDKSIEIQKNVIEQQKLTAIVRKRNKIRNYKMIIHSNDHLK